MNKKTVALVGGAFALGALSVAGGVAIGAGLAGGSPVPPDTSVVAAPAPISAETEGLSEPTPTSDATRGTSDFAPTAIEALQRNTVAAVSGTVERITDEDEFVLRDATGTIPVWTGGAMVPVQPGEPVTVRGYVDDDLLIELYAQEIVRENGQVIILRGRG